MNRKAGAQISMRVFLQSLIILFVLMMLAGLLTRLVPASPGRRAAISYLPSSDILVWKRWWKRIPP